MLNLLRMTLFSTLLLGIGLPVSIRGEEIFPVSEIRRGMKGYGLSVFEGTGPERFDVVAVAVMPNSLPRQDLILVRCSGQGLERSGVIAGMSGSPVYFDGRLAGAVAYGWTFGKDALAGVTPIQAMLDELKRPRPVRPVSPGKTGLKRLATPLMMSGFRETMITVLRDRLGDRGFLPVLGAGGGTSRITTAVPPIPGGAVGAPMIRGDWDLSAVGTITYVDEQNILGFGHPFYGMGSMNVPATGAEVHTVFASSEFSFKMASPTEEIGALVEDRQSGIVIDRTTRAPMIPLVIRSRNGGTGREQTFNLEVMDDPILTPELILISLFNALETAEATTDDLTVQVRVEVALQSGRTILLEDRFHNGRTGAFSMESFDPFLALTDNPFEIVRIGSVVCDVELLPRRQTATILQAYPSAGIVEPGAELQVQVVIKPYGEDPRVLSIPVRLPPQLEEGTLAFEIAGGTEVPLDLAEPEDLEGLVHQIEKRNRNTDLMLSYELPGALMKNRGVTIAHVPDSVQAIIGTEEEQVLERSKTGTEWVLSGSATAWVEVHPPAVIR